MHRSGGGCGPRSWSGRGPRGRGGHDGEGRSRFFEQGELRLVLLTLIAEAPRHGYDLIRAVEERTGGAYAPSPGVVYPTLTLLEDMGLIEADSSEGSKKLYRITPAGATHLAERSGHVDAVMARMTEAHAEATRGDITPVLRAMANLRNALRLRLARGQVDAETARRAAALIDELAAKIDTL
jgi:DNA-binding PadR family transcriptional regulator